MTRYPTSIGRLTTIGRLGRACALAIVLPAMIAPAAAQPIADTFRGKTIRLLLPTLPGGGRALYSLPFAAYFGKHVPGNPTILPVFMPGAGGSTAVNNAYSVAEPDGLTIVSPLASVITAQAVGDQSVKYDAAKLSWVGRITDGTRIFFVSSNVNARTIADFRNRETVIGATGRASETFMNASFMNKVFGTKFKVITGYPSASKMNMSVESGETEGAFTTWNDISTYHPDWVRDGKIRIVVQIALNKHPDLASVPQLLELAENEADRDLIAFMSSPTQMGQSYAAPPGTPAPILNALRRAFDDTMKDPAYIEKMRAAKIQFNPMSGEELARNVAATVGAPKSVIERFKAAASGD